MAKGIEETIRKRGAILDLLVPINQAPGSPIANEIRTLKKACFSVKSVMRNIAEFSQTVTLPPAPKALKKARVYGSKNAKDTAKTSGSARQIIPGTSHSKEPEVDAKAQSGRGRIFFLPFSLYLCDLAGNFFSSSLCLRASVRFIFN